MNKPFNNVYCYVDESGQHTQGKSFSVAVILVNEVDALKRVEKQLIDIEKKTKKGTLKWKSTHYSVKEKYLRNVMAISELKNCIFYSIYTNTRSYVYSTVETIVEAIKKYVTKPYKVSVMIDGLNKKTRQRIIRHLKQEGVMYKKVRGMKDEGSAWIRLADAIAGFSRHVDEKKPYTQSLYPEMKRNRFLIQL